MEINKAQKLVWEHLSKIGYTDIETNSMHAFLHLIEEIGEVSRALLYKETDRASISNTSDPGNLEDEVADILWQTLKLASYLDIDLEESFKRKYEKNRRKNDEKN